MDYQKKIELIDYWLRTGNVPEIPSNLKSEISEEDVKSILIESNSFQSKNPLEQLRKLKDSLIVQEQVFIQKKQVEIQDSQTEALRQTNLIYKLALYATGIVALITAYNFYFELLDSKSSQFSNIVGGILVIVIAIVVTLLLLKFIKKIMPEVKEFLPFQIADLQNIDVKRECNDSVSDKCINIKLCKNKRRFALVILIIFTIILGHLYFSNKFPEELPYYQHIIDIKTSYDNGTIKYNFDFSGNYSYFIIDNPHSRNITVTLWGWQVISEAIVYENAFSETGLLEYIKPALVKQGDYSTEWTIQPPLQHSRDVKIFLNNWLLDKNKRIRVVPNGHFLFLLEPHGFYKDRLQLNLELGKYRCYQICFSDVSEGLNLHYNPSSNTITAELKNPGSYALSFNLHTYDNNNKKFREFILLLLIPFIFLIMERLLACFDSYM